MVPRLGPLVTLITANVLFGTGLFFHAFLYNFYLQALGHGEGVMGLAAAALTAGGLASLLPAGWLTDRIGPRNGLALAAGVAALGLAAGAVVVTPTAVYAAASAAGAGGGLWRVGVAPALMRVTDASNRPRAFGWNVGLLVVSGGVGMAVAGSLPGWLEAWLSLDSLAALRVGLVMGACGSLLASPLFLALRDVGGGAPTPPGRPSPAEHRAARSVLPLVALVALWMLGPALAAPFFNIFFERAFDLAIDRIGLVFAASHILWGLAVFMSGGLAQRLGVERALAAALLAFAPAMWGISAVSGLVMAVTFYIVQGVISPLTNPLIDQVLLGRVPPERHGLVSSWRNVAADVSAIVGASAGGWLLAQVSFDALFVAAGSVGLLGGAGLIVGLRRWSPGWAARATQS